MRDEEGAKRAKLRLLRGGARKNPKLPTLDELGPDPDPLALSAILDDEVDRRVLRQAAMRAARIMRRGARTMENFNEALERVHEEVPEILDVPAEGVVEAFVLGSMTDEEEERFAVGMVSSNQFQEHIAAQKIEIVEDVSNPEQREAVENQILASDRFLEELLLHSDLSELAKEERDADEAGWMDSDQDAAPQDRSAPTIWQVIRQFIERARRPFRRHS